MATKGDANKKTKRPTAIKRNIQNENRRLQNKSFKSVVRTTMNAFEASLKSGNATVVQAELSKVYSLMDKGVKNGVFKLNKASRTKARFTARAAKIS